MATRIEVAYREGIRDVPGEKLRARLKSELGRDVTVHVVDVYTVDAALNDNVVEMLRTDVLIDPVASERVCPHAGALRRRLGNRGRVQAGRDRQRGQDRAGSDRGCGTHLLQ